MSRYTGAGLFVILRHTLTQKQNCVCFFSIICNFLLMNQHDICFVSNREEMTVRRVWQVKVGQRKCKVCCVQATPFPNYSVFFLWPNTQNLTNSWKRGQKPQRWHPPCLPLLAAIQVQHRELPTARSQQDQRMDCSLCRRPIMAPHIQP